MCDLVEVTDEKWRLASEAALGRSREALIVEPSVTGRALEIYRRGSDDAYEHAEVVNTTKTLQTRPAEKGSLAIVISTGAAVAELDTRITALTRAIEDANRKRDPKLVREQTDLKTDRGKAKAQKSKAHGDLSAAQNRQDKAAWTPRKYLETDLPEMRSVRMMAGRMDLLPTLMDETMVKAHGKPALADPSLAAIAKTDGALAPLAL